MYLKHSLLEPLEKAIFHPTIPVLDLNDFYQPSTQDTFLSVLSKALQEVGFFAIINSGVDQISLDNAYCEAKKFFQSPMAIKHACYNPENNGDRGYVPSETAKGQTQKDFKEFFHVGPEIQNDQHPNLWPPTNITFKKSMLSLFSALEQHIQPIQQALALSLKLPKNFFQEMTKGGELKLRAIHYPANPPKNAIWAAAHTDIDLFTILPRATHQGLQVKNQQGEWIDVRVPKNAFIINAGDMLENITNGFYRSSQHRVVYHESSAARLSMVMFVHPKSHDDISPLDCCIAKTGGKQLFPNTTQNELLAERLVDLGLASQKTIEMLAHSTLVEQLIDLNRASPHVVKILIEKKLASPKILQHLTSFSEFC